MNGRTRFITATVFLVLLGTVLHAQDGTAQTLTAALLVKNPEATVTRLVAFTEERGGYFLYTSFSRAILRLPLGETAAFRTLLEEVALAILDYSQVSRDLSEEMAYTQAALKARREILERNLAFLDRADVNGTLAIEREVTSLMNEIENLAAQLQRLGVDAAYARIEVNLSFQGQTLPEVSDSSFPWINTVDPFLFIQGGLP